MKTKHTPRNWNGMTKAQKRVAIAKDVLAQVHCGALIPVTGTYSDPRARTRNDVFYKKYADTTTKELRCHACAVGSAFLSIARFTNGKTVFDLITISEGGEDIISPVFTKYQRAMIECAFEGRDVSLRMARSPEWKLIEQEQAKQFYSDHRSDMSRLIAIFQNIIDHNGEFVPSVRYDVGV